MNILEVTKREIDYGAYTNRRAAAGDCSTVITEPTILTCGGEIIAIYTLLEEDTNQVLAACNAIKYDVSTRTSGLKTRSKIFGYSPRNVLRKDYCNRTKLHIENPAADRTITEFGRTLTEHYQKLAPETFNQHIKELDEKILPEWRIEGSAFTSGIVNKNNPLKYHLDTGNLREVFSCMLVLRENVDGGLLCLPEYDVAFFLQNKSLFMFDGQGILHGVTPMKVQPGGYRYSLVYYALIGLWKCLTLDEELIRIKKLRTEREMKRANV